VGGLHDELLGLRHVVNDPVSEDQQDIVLLGVGGPGQGCLADCTVQDVVEQGRAGQTDTAHCALVHVQNALDSVHCRVALLVQCEAVHVFYSGTEAPHRNLFVAIVVFQNRTH